MGGPGSGKCVWKRGKLTTENVCSVSINQLVAEGLFSQVGTAKVDLMRYDEPFGKVHVHSWVECITLFDTKEINPDFPSMIDQDILIKTTPCNFGGCRPWFVCPQCNNAVGILYMIPSQFYWEFGTNVACRKCHRLYYPSQLEGEFDRASRQVRKTQRRLGKSDWYNEMEPFFPRPKGMHRDTYLKIIAKTEHSFEISRKKWAAMGMRISPIYKLTALY